MTFKKTSLAAAALLFALYQAPAGAVTLRSSDESFSLSVPGKWQGSVSTDPASALLLKKGRAEIKIRVLPEFSDEKALKTKIQATQKKLKKGGVAVPNRISTVVTEEGGKLYFIQFVSKGKGYRSGFFNLAGRSYSFLLTGLSKADFEAICVSLAPLQEELAPAAPAKPVERLSAPAAASLPATEKLAAPPAGNLQPASSTDTLAAPPAAAFTAGEALPEPGELPPLPKRSVGDALFLFLALAAVSAGALGYRAFAGRNRAAEPPGAPPAPDSLFPFRVERRYFSFPIIFDVKDAAGQQYKAVSYRVPALLLGTGVLAYFLIKVLLQVLGFAGVEITTLPDVVLLVLVRALSLANLLMFAGVVLGLFFRKKLKVYDAAGGLVLDVCEKRMTFSSQYFLIRDPQGNQLGKMKRVGFVLIRRRWQLLDADDKVLLDIREDSASRAIARKFLGHLWGLLRTSYIISDESSGIGQIKRDWSIWNRYSLELAPVQGLPAPDPRLVMATSLFIDIVDPDRWHPWHG